VMMTRVRRGMVRVRRARLVLLSSSRARVRVSVRAVRRVRVPGRRRLLRLHRAHHRVERGELGRVHALDLERHRTTGRSKTAGRGVPSSEGAALVSATDARGRHRDAPAISSAVLGRCSSLRSARAARATRFDALARQIAALVFGAGGAKILGTGREKREENDPARASALGSRRRR